jgi:hypothetical protein
MTDCPSLYELTSKQVLPPQLAAHVRGCPRCRALVAAWQEQPVDEADLAAEAAVAVAWPWQATGDPDVPPTEGAIHSVWGPESGELLVALVMDVDEAEALVVPISTETHLAGDWDVELDPDVLPYPAIAELWNHLHVLREQLAERLAVLPQEAFQRLDAAVDAMFDSQPAPDDLAQGPAILTAADPRQSFRDAEARHVRAFVEPWRALNVGESLGEVIAARREEMSAPLAGLADELDFSSDTLGRIEANREDLHAAVPVATMERLRQRLRLVASQRLADLIHNVVFENDSTPPPDQAVAFARRRRGQRSRSGPPPEEVRRQHADEYVQRLTKMWNAR